MVSLSNNNNLPEQTQTLIVIFQVESFRGKKNVYFQNSSVRPTRNRTASKPSNSFWRFTNPIRKTSSLQDISSPSNTLPISSPIQSDEIEKNLHRKKSIVSKEKETKNLYQLWRELKHAEQLILCNSDFTQFINYLTKTEYVNYNESVQFIPPDNQVEEYYLMAEIKLESQMKFLSKLFVLKRSKLFSQQSNQEKKYFDDLFKAFENHYNTQIEKAKKHFKSK